MTDLRDLAQKWRSEYQVAIEHDRRHGLRETTTELGGKAIAADELDHALQAEARPNDDQHLEYLAERVVRELWVTSVGMVHSKPMAARTAILRALREVRAQEEGSTRMMSHADWETVKTLRGDYALDRDERNDPVTHDEMMAVHQHTWVTRCWCGAYHPADALAPQPAPTAWMPIESAPKDGTRVLLCYQAHGSVWMNIGYWGVNRQQWLIGGVGNVPSPLWMPLPQPPSANAGATPTEEMVGRICDDETL